MVIFILTIIAIAFLGFMVENPAYRLLCSASRLFAIVFALGASMVIQNGIMPPGLMGINVNNIIVTKLNSEDILFKISDLEISYGSIAAIKGISLQVQKGEIITILGSNSAGKTTTMRAISRLIKAESGSIMFKGHELARLPAHKVVSLGIIHSPEGRRVFNILSVEENLLLGAYTKSKVDQEILAWGYDLFPRLQERKS